MLDAIIIGGGFYGCSIAAFLARRKGYDRIALLEAESRLLSRASYHNQARIHGGYHYPRSYTTAYRSQVNFPRFLQDWPEAVKTDFTKLYAIARHRSSISARYFERFCLDIGADVQSAAPHLRRLFDPRLIEEVFQVEEYVFDASKLADRAREELSKHAVHVSYETRATAISRGPDATLIVTTQSPGKSTDFLRSRHVFNCTYSGLNHFGGDFRRLTTGLKHEITEMPLLELPESLQQLGVTVMDGPFFSLMPFPPIGLHTLSHVRFTPHLEWDDQPGQDARERLYRYDGHSRVDRMLRDAGRYIPDLLEAVHKTSLFETKTILRRNERDDGRPILFEHHQELPGCYSILGGKIDNIYDVLECIHEKL
ncbi:FAD-dependent oxidoreductase [Pseudomonas resinovorans]|uniref:FAD-dependent oxidoreductase n=1 Tax=Metapseudomonas resinovorans TaxID=53412 RepID=UPI00237F5FBB|nr:FAD-dependent oxidoreductase [Pseudomonas resinovorans]MDE3739660.1 FAD-dependent oxidoreductase [Pseudomonas resinovorans]